MKVTKSIFIYNLCVNIPICFFLCLTSALLMGFPIDWLNFLLNYALSFFLAMMIGLFIPLARIGKWFTRLFKVDATTYTNNLKYRLLATLSSSFIFFIILNPLLTILNNLILSDATIKECLLSWLINIPPMLLIGFFSSLIFDLPGYKLAKKMDDTF